MKKNNNTNSNYEFKGVFGDEDKYKDARHRFKKMIEIIESLDIEKGNILDVGCGTGYLSAKVKEIFPKANVYGTDISQKAIETGMVLYKDVNLTMADSEERFPFEDNFFDLIISGEHIAHLKDTDTYVFEISRVLKKNATLILTTPNLVSWLNRILMLIGRAPFFFEPLLHTSIPVWSFLGVEFPNKHMLPSGHLRLFNINMLKKILSVYGIRVTKTYGVSSLNNKFIKPADLIFSNVSDLASGIIIIGKKE